MKTRLYALLAALLLAGCSGPVSVPAVDQTAASAPDALPAAAPIPVEEAAVAAQPLPQAVEAVADAVSTPLLAAQEAVETLTPTLPPPEAANAACRRVAAALIIRWEVSSPAFYRKKLEKPIWPGGASGVTWGIGYDGGHQTRATIVDDWQEHEAVERLGTTAGITGQQARAILSQYRDIPTAFEYASRVFEERSLIEYERRTERAFDTDLAAMKPGACAALVSLVYNRGASMTGDSRREMRNIRDQCLPNDHACTAAELRSMKRLWRGTVNENGLSARREAEAQLAEGG